MKRGLLKKGFAAEYLLYGIVTLAVMVLCVCVGSVSVSLRETLRAFWSTATGGGTLQADKTVQAIIISIRLPRVLCVAFVGASLSLCGCAMQGLLRNPLADGSTLGVSSGAALGAVLSIALGITFPNAPFAGSVVLSVLFAFLSLLVILTLAHRMDYTLATNTIILMGVVFSMFINSIISFIVAFSGEKLKTITFWMLGSLSGSSYRNVLLLAVCLFICAGILLTRARELNAFALGEDNARNIGVDVRRTKLTVLIAVSALIGVCVSVGGSIGFVGLIIPHMARMVTGPNHQRLMPAVLFFGSVFLMFADLLARTVLSPLELPIGVVTSFVGAMVFGYIFYRTRRRRT